jgi:hypothetical protein
MAMTRTRGSRSLKAMTSYSRSKVSSPSSTSWLNAWVAELHESDEAHAAPVEQPADLLDEVTVVADEDDVGLARAQLGQRALDRDVDDLLPRCA